MDDYIERRKKTRSEISRQLCERRCPYPEAKAQVGPQREGERKGSRQLNRDLVLPGDCDAASLPDDTDDLCSLGRCCGDDITLEPQESFLQK